MAIMTPDKLEELHSSLDDMRTAGFAYTQRWHGMWQDGLKYLYGDQGVEDDCKEGWDPVVHNHIFPAMMQELAVQSQRRQTILARPQEEKDTEGAGHWQGHLQWLFAEELRTEMFLLRAALDGKVYGRYVAYNYWEPKAEWDDEARKWKGAIRVKLVPSEYFAHDPEVDDLDEAEYFVTARRMPKALAMDRWPKMADKIDKSGGDESPDWMVNSDHGMSTLAFKDVSDPGTVMGNLNRLTALLTHGHKQHTRGTDATESKYVTIEQFIFKDRQERKGQSTEEISEEELEAEGVIHRDPDPKNLDVWLNTKTGKPMMGDEWPKRKIKGNDEPLYPHGRLVLRIGDTILNPDTDSQRFQYRKWPYTIGLNHLLPHSAMGLNSVEMTRCLQDRVNIGARHLMNWVRTSSDPVILKEEDAMPPKKKIRNVAGSIWTVCKGGLAKIRREPPPPVGAGLFQVMQMQTADLRDLTGVQEVGLGRSGAGAQTAREIVELQTNSRLRGALGNKLMDFFLKELYVRIAEQCAKMYTVEDMVRVMGEDGADTAVRISQGMLSAKYDIGLEIGTSMPFDQELERQQAGELFGLIGMSFLPQLLDAYEREDKDEILEAHQAYQMFLQFQAAMEAEQDAMEAEQPEGAQPQAAPAV